MALDSPPVSFSGGAWDEKIGRGGNPIVGYTGGGGGGGSAQKERLLRACSILKGNEIY